MHPERVRTAAFFVAGVLLLVQFLVQQVGPGIQASGIVLLAAATIFLGLAIVRVRSPPPATERSDLGIVEFTLLVFVGVLFLITAGLSALVLL